MSYRQGGTPATPEDDRLKRPYFSMDLSGPIEAQKRRKVSRAKNNNNNQQQPRWHNQAYMLYLALRQHTGRTMARTDLIKSALAIDKRISEERLLPKVFRGKTPMNSASAILTNNSDRYFIPFKPEGSKSMHFRLSFEPGNFESALRDYHQWQEDLVQHDWPIYFGVKKAAIMSENMVKDLEVTATTTTTATTTPGATTPGATATTKYPTEFDEFIAKRKRERLEQGVEKENCKKITPTRHYGNNQAIQAPKAWREVIAFLNSTDPRQPYLLRARCHLPKNVPLGFYFGVPLTEDEFDAMKEGVGKAADRCYMYKNKTVIDPTDEFGNFYLVNSRPLCPFHVIKETTSPEKANVAFYEGNALNQIVCWTKKDIPAGDELVLYSPPRNRTNKKAISATSNNTTSNIIPHQNTPNIVRPVPIAPIRNNIPPPSPQSNNTSWQKKPSISSMLNTTIPTI